MQMDDKRLKQLHSVYQRQKDQKANKQIDAAAGALLTLATECFGPIDDPTAAVFSEADGLRYYGQQNEEFAALLHMAGMGEALGLPKPHQRHFERWGSVKARAHLKPQRSKVSIRRR